MPSSYVSDSELSHTNIGFSDTSSQDACDREVLFLPIPIQKKACY